MLVLGSSHVLSVRPSAWYNSSTTDLIFMKFDIYGFFFRMSVEEFQVSLKSDTEKRVLYMTNNIRGIVK